MTPLTRLIELIDKCVGSRIWVVMKGDKGKLKFDV
ncbi:Small nuclear ribonucleoprotein (LSM5), putative [Penicillium digitatum PHI26]|uniref:Small nuclear ribonucleoprotein (LSM5), putative n=2 Tax=Penicillium digitatum TaxID=36651 RepID=K9GAH1_PEND2|nr:Small nuclear ribonucleoprotein (LSM5), putative [Penicillium digitatum Pd1]EKV05561.1 Small nuclear ribonucleoprotein (LSM5), putative [Penicillium digitatum Pd1]EKV18142.1 Small nuclear ribonucleoprotein (LSM5), putative [Penicillium digitatum PHI26]